MLSGSIEPIAKNGILIFSLAHLTYSKPTGILPGFVGVLKTGPTPI